MKSRDRDNFRKMIGAMAVIMTASALMHIFVFSKSPRAYRKNLASASSASSENPTPVTGRVTVLGTDRFYLDDADGRRWMFALQGNPAPSIGSQLTVYYRNTNPLELTRSIVLSKGTEIR